LGVGYIDNQIMGFMNKLFEKGQQDLSNIILKGLTETLNSKPVVIKSGVTNDVWLKDNVKPELDGAMDLLKSFLMKKIIILIYGPSTRIKPLTLPPNFYGNNFLLTQNYQDLSAESYLENAALQDVMFTTVNTVGNNFGDIEYNILKMKEQLAKGVVTFTISCQDVKINLPEQILASADAIIDNNIKVFLQGQTVGGGPVTYQNPAGVLVELNGYVENQTQQINSEENAAAVRKSWIRILLDKLINLLPIVLYPILQKILDKINLAIQSTLASITGSNVEVPANEPVLQQELGQGRGAQSAVISARLSTTIVPGTLTVKTGSETYTDNGTGSLIGDSGGSGVIDYNTGVGFLTGTTVITDGTLIIGDYQKTPPNPFSINLPLLTVENTLGLFTSIKNEIKNGNNLFDKNSIFYKIAMNALYSLVLKIILKVLLPKITKLIAKALAKRNANKLQRKYKRQQEKIKIARQKAEEFEKSAEGAKALKVVKAVFDYAKSS
jgi:hypothetical protein